jgi:hypothetical protein
MKRFIIKNTETGEFLKGTGKYLEWTTFENADLYKRKLTDFWWSENMELVEVKVNVIKTTEIW